jgi:hypothetical protein
MVLVRDRDCVGSESGNAAMVTELADQNERAQSKRWKNGGVLDIVIDGRGGS